MPAGSAAAARGQNVRVVATLVPEGSPPSGLHGDPTRSHHREHERCLDICADHPFIPRVPRTP